MFRASHPSIKYMMNFFSFRVVELSFFFLGEEPLSFFSRFCPSPPPQIINGSSLRAEGRLAILKKTCHEMF